MNSYLVVPRDKFKVLGMLPPSQYGWELIVQGKRPIL
jgi:hypothetical protein